MLNNYLYKFLSALFCSCICAFFIAIPFAYSFETFEGLIGPIVDKDNNFAKKPVEKNASVGGAHAQELSDQQLNNLTTPTGLINGATTDQTTPAVSPLGNTIINTPTVANVPNIINSVDPDNLQNTIVTTPDSAFKGFLINPSLQNPLTSQQ